MKNKIFSYIIIFGIMYVFSIYNLTQISEKEFLSDYIGNVTRMEIYNQQKAYLFLNNNTGITHYLHIRNDTSFEDKLEEGREFEIYHKESRMQELIDFSIQIFIYFLIKY